MERERKNVTIKDVAKRAGVAISTVSRVLNGLDKVSEKTQKKVRDAVEELGYVQNALAVSMVTGQTKTILMAVPDFTNDFNAAVIQAGGNDAKAVLMLVDRQVVFAFHRTVDRLGKLRREAQRFGQVGLPVKVDQKNLVPFLT